VLRDQAFLLPPNTADWLPDKHLVWFGLDVVAQLDTAAFHATRKTGGVGRQGYDPDMLLALMFYAYSVGERSSRRIERLCTEHVAFRILCGQDASRWPPRLGPKLIRWTEGMTARRPLAAMMVSNSTAPAEGSSTNPLSAPLMSGVAVPGTASAAA
jgi:hypothetical protein